MKLRTIKYFFKESINNLWRNRIMMIAAVVSMVAVLFITGTILLVLLNVNRIVSNIESQVEVTVYLKEQVTDDQIQEIEHFLQSMQGVNDIKFVSKEEALEKAKDWLGGKEELLEGYEGEKNPMPASFIIKVDKPEYAEQISKSIQDKPGVEKVKFGEQLVDTLTKLVRITRWAGFMLFAILTVVSMVIISNTIKLALTARKQEIQIMKYVGATDWFIQWPFILEGLLIAVISSVISTLLIGIAYNYAVSRFGSIIDIISILSFEEVILNIFYIFLGVGCLISTIASILSIRKYVKV